jgi:hypothetical protein
MILKAATPTSCKRSAHLININRIIIQRRFTVTGKCTTNNRFVKRIIKSTSFNTPHQRLYKPLFYRTTKVNISIRSTVETILEDKAIASSSPPKNLNTNRSFIIEDI